jgi:phage terminase small subunit
MAQLNAKQKLFVEAFLVERNGTQAVMAAGFSSNAKSAGVTATRLLANANVREAIDRGIKAQQDRLEITADKVIKAIAEIAFDPHANQHAKLKATEQLGRHFKLFTDVIENPNAPAGVQVVLTMPANGSEAKVKTTQKKGK